MLKQILLFFVYAIVGTFGLYKIKVFGSWFDADFFLGCVAYAASSLIYLLIIRITPLSTSVPVLTSMLIVSTCLIGVWYFDEPLNFNKLIGIMFIIAGIIFISKNI